MSSLKIRNGDRPTGKVQTRRKRQALRHKIEEWLKSRRAAERAAAEAARTEEPAK
jgi:hypothetical protein